MNAKHIIATVAFAFAGSAFAADAPVANSAATAAAAVATTPVAAAAVTASSLNIPTVSVSAGTQRSRADVHAEAVQTVKTYKSTIATQLDHAKN